MMIVYLLAIFQFLGLVKASLFFSETFNEDPFLSGKWIKFKDEKYIDQPVVVQPSSSPVEGFESDNGLLLSQDHKYYGFGTKFLQPLEMKNELVIQYELKLEETLNCGGAYIKLPRATDDLDIASVTNETPYTIMFGPDKCGSSNNKVHFILQHQNPITKVWEEKHAKDTPTTKTDKKTHLYTLAIKSDNSYELYIDKKSSKTGNLLESMVPPINPPKSTDDPTDLKPQDWVDEKEIVDETASKPNDWDESAPKMIPDPKAQKPEKWDEHAPAKIPDPNAVKPEDWDDEEDGEWEAPEIDNPICEKAGCGEWKPPMIKNPAYKGKWSAPKIPNPAYKGEWKPRQIDNPEYYFDSSPALNMHPMGGLVVEVWTINKGIFFDNFVIAHSLTEAFKFAEGTWDKKNAVEMKKKKEKKNKEALETGGVKGVYEVMLSEGLDWVKENYLTVIATIVTLLVALLFLIFSMPQRKKAASPAPSSSTEATSAESKSDAKDDEKKAEKKE